MTDLYAVRDLVEQVDDRVGSSESAITPLSVSEVHGIVPQEKLYNKKIALEDRRKYRLVRWGDIAYNPFLLWNRAVGTCFVKDGGCVSPAYVVLRPKEEGTERFLHYFFRSSRFTDRINAIASGTVTRRRTAPVDDVLDQTFELPSLSSQREINAFLTAIDKRVDGSLALGQALDRLCFEDYLRAINRAKSLVRLGDLVDVNPENVKAKAPDDDILYVDVGSVRTNESDPPARMKWSDAPSRAKRATRDGDVIYGTVRPGKRSLLMIDSPPEELVISTGFAVLRPTELSSSQLLSVVYDPAFSRHFAAVAEGSAYPAINAADLQEREVNVIGDREEAADYESRTAPIRRYRARLSGLAHGLGDMRNRLVPSLLDGDRSLVGGAVV